MFAFQPLPSAASLSFTLMHRGDVVLVFILAFAESDLYISRPYSLNILQTQPGLFSLSISLRSGARPKLLVVDSRPPPLSISLLSLRSLDLRAMCEVGE